MSNIGEFLEELHDDGDHDSVGGFTLAPEKLRQKLAESVPEGFRNGWSAVRFLDAAFRLAGLEPAPAVLKSLGDTGVVPVVPISLTSLESTPVYLGLRYKVSDPDCWLEKSVCLNESLERAFEQPFGDSSPLGLCLSRAILVLSQLKLSTHFAWVGSDLSSRTLVFEDFVVHDQRVSRIASGVDRGLVVYLDTAKEWYQAAKSDQYNNPYIQVPKLLAMGHPLRIELSLQSRSRAKELALFGFPTQLQSPWTRSPSRELIELNLVNHQGSWFDYRTSEAVLAEVLVPAETTSPLMVSSDCVSASSGLEVERPSRDLSSWQRFVGQGEKLILRWWDSPPKAIEDRFFCRAIFAVGLSDRPSQAVFLNWGNTFEVTLLTDCPPGLGALVYWPTLTQSLYGESWVKDEEYQAALDWTLAQTKMIFAKLHQEIDFVYAMLERDHLRKTYKSEVRSRLESWFAG